MKLTTRVIAHAEARKPGHRVITAAIAFGLNVRDSLGVAAGLTRYYFFYFGSNVQPWKRAAMWVCLALNLMLAFLLARLGDPLSFVALLGCWTSLNYLDSTEAWGLRRTKP